MAKRTVGLTERRAIRDRLRLVVKARYEGNLAEFGRRYAVAHGTLVAWFTDRPTPPSTPVLVELAQRDRDGVDLHWLLLGEGQPFRPPRFQRLKGAPLPEIQRYAADILARHLAATARASRKQAKRRSPRRKRSSRRRTK